MASPNRRNTTALSVEADKPYIKAMRALAATRGISVGRMVRQALDAQLGVELEPFALFFAADGPNDVQTENTNITSQYTSEI